MGRLNLFRKRAGSAPLEDLTIDHSSIRNADPYAFQIAHRRLAWMLRISGATNIGLLVALGLSLSAFTALVPLKEVRPALLRIDPADNRVYRVEPISQDVPGFDLLLEQISRRYVRNMLEIDSVTQTMRFQEAFIMTDRAFYEEFRKTRIETGAIQDAIKDGITRSITVESVNVVRKLDNVWELAVDITQTDNRNGENVEEKKLRAYLKITTRPHEVAEAEKYENPLGIRVLDMSLKERANL
ncbi:VirB8/TrbF family protein [Kiloniella laminariae]|uniref:VirB8/TrbF family protein n=1 Tax=Kiloniella laminariae TaxID=454162 RepID=UPI000380C731|nr:VirB8/TrbF family protein [Kiloniella laminariae]